MSYSTLKKDLLYIFQQNKFRDFWENGEKLSSLNNGKNPNINRFSYQFPNDYNLNTKINYPGYKTSINKYKRLIYDYRVDLNNIAISHVNILVDLYSKGVQAPHLIKDLYTFLINLAYEGDKLSVLNYIRISTFNFLPPDNDLLNRIENIHKNLGKKYLRMGNHNWSYSIEELATIIPLIVLQEDINYPMPKCDGRRMSFYRYLEALYCAANPYDMYCIEDVIERALSHTRPVLWKCINYRAISEIPKRTLITI